MQYVDLPIVDINECERVYRNRPEEVDTDRMMCAGYNASNFQEKDACQGIIHTVYRFCLKEDLPNTWEIASVRGLSRRDVLKTAGQYWQLKGSFY